MLRNKCQCWDTALKSIPVDLSQVFHSGSILIILGTSIFSSLERFHVTSYQANFTSHRPRDRHVGFLSPQSGIGKHNKKSQNFSFIICYNTKLQLSDKNISSHTRVEFEILS